MVKKLALMADPTLPKIPLLAPLKALVDPSVQEPGDYDLINYYGKPFTLPGIPFYRLVSSDEPPPPELLRDKVLVVGWTERSINAIDPDRRDSFLTPVSDESMYGVEIHGTIAANLLEKNWLRRYSPKWIPHLTVPEWDTLVAFVVCFLMTQVTTTYSVRRTAPWLIAGAALWFWLSYLAFSRLNYFVPAATLCGVVLPIFLMLMAYAESRREAKRRLSLENAIGMVAKKETK